MLWLNSNGQLICDGNGHPIDCGACPCGTCPECDTLGSALTVEFLADVNIHGDAAGCGGSCADWIAAWDLHPLSPAEVASLSANWPTTYPQTVPPRAAGCYFGLFAGLPCGATSMVAQIVEGGGDGQAVTLLTIGWADGVYVRITSTHAVSPASKDCIANLTREDEGVPGCGLGIEVAGAAACDFALLAVGAAREMVLTMVA